MFQAKQVSWMGNGTYKFYEFANKLYVGTKESQNSEDF